LMRLISSWHSIYEQGRVRGAGAAQPHVHVQSVFETPPIARGRPTHVPADIHSAADPDAGVAPAFC